jgi:hypothetical protein
MEVKVGPSQRKMKTFSKSLKEEFLRLYGPNNEGGIWRIRYDNELSKLYNELDIE